MMKKVMTILFLTLFLGVMFGGLFHMTFGMSMSGDMTGCPFMSEGETVCPMSAFDHLVAWQDIFTATTASFLSLLILVAAMTCVFVARAPHVLRKYILTYATLYRSIRAALYTFSYRILQDFFARGILHPKLF